MAKAAWRKGEVRYSPTRAERQAQADLAALPDPDTVGDAGRWVNDYCVTRGHCFHDIGGGLGCCCDCSASAYIVRW